jgi:hypothetical protein
MRSQTTPHCRPLATLASHTTLIPRGRHLSTIILFIDPWPTGRLIYAPVPASWLDPAAALCPWSSFSSQSARAAIGGRLRDVVRGRHPPVDDDAFGGLGL